MSRLYEYVQTELFPELTPTTFKLQSLEYKISTLNLIKDKCSQILREYDKVNRVLFRGVRETDLTNVDDTNNIFMSYPRDNRWPKDTPDYVHTLLDDAFYKRFKWRVRSQGVFASSFGTALGYGKPFVFLPVNGYKYVWSTQINDLYSDFAENFRWWEYNVRDVEGRWVSIDDPSVSLRYPEQARGYVKHKTDWSNKNRYKWITTITTEEEGYRDKKVYKWIPDMTEKEWEEERGHEIDKVIGSYEDKNLSAGMRMSKQKEFTFKCDKYYMIRVPNSAATDLTLKDIGLDK